MGLRRAAKPPASNPSQLPLPAPHSGSGEGGRGEGQAGVMPQRAPNTSGKKQVAYGVQLCPLQDSREQLSCNHFGTLDNYQEKGYH